MGDGFLGSLEIVTLNQQVDVVRVTKDRVRVDGLGEGGALENQEGQALPPQSIERSAGNLTEGLDAKLLSQVCRLQDREKTWVGRQGILSDAGEEERTEALPTPRVRSEEARKVLNPGAESLPGGAALEGANVPPAQGASGSAPSSKRIRAGPGRWSVQAKGHPSFRGTSRLAPVPVQRAFEAGQRGVVRRPHRPRQVRGVLAPMDKETGKRVIGDPCL
jgi:hypothetical protein